MVYTVIIAEAKLGRWVADNCLVCFAESCCRVQTYVCCVQKAEAGYMPASPCFGNAECQQTLLLQASSTSVVMCQVT